MKLLVVEDEAKTGDYLRQGLTEAGFVVDLARSGPDGAHLATTEDYDLVVLDIMLPGLDGWGVLQRIRGSGRSMPVLFLTARGQVDDGVKGLELGADDHLVKPFAFSELLARVRTLPPRPIEGARGDPRGRRRARPHAPASGARRQADRPHRQGVGYGLVARMDASGNKAYYDYDGIGNTRYISDDGGVIINAYDYDPFGILIASNELIPNLFQYSGKFGVIDDVHGLQYMRARIYDSYTGRFISTDPLLFKEGDINLYQYSLNNPITFIDPKGCDEVPDVGYVTCYEYSHQVGEVWIDKTRERQIQESSLIHEYTHVLQCIRGERLSEAEACQADTEYLAS